jgi:hypothetical protein
MSYMIIGYDIYDCFTMEHFRLRQRMTLTTKIHHNLLITNQSCNKIMPIRLTDFYKKSNLVKDVEE